jgi:hypothetical protein
MSKVASGLVALAGALQAGLTAVGIANGGLAAVVLNKHTLAWVGLGLVALAAAILVLYLAFGPSDEPGAGGGPPVSWPWKALTFVGGGAIVGGVAVTAYAVLAVPAISGEPKVIASLTWGKPLVLNATVKANAVKRNEVFHVEVDGLKENNVAFSYKFIPPVLYQVQLGADGSGNVDENFSIPVPSHAYDDIGVSAWTGDSAGPCFALKKSESSVASGKPNLSRRGCSVVRVRGLPDP